MEKASYANSTAFDTCFIISVMKLFLLINIILTVREYVSYASSIDYAVTTAIILYFYHLHMFIQPKQTMRRDLTLHCK